MNFKKKSILYIFSTVAFLSMTFSESHAEVGMTQTSTKKHGSAYWQTSSIREWLNSDARSVSYTQTRPNSERLDKYAYDTEPGFLTNFTTTEKNAIAVTRRKAILNWETGVTEGGSRHIPLRYVMKASSTQLEGIQNNWDSYFYQILNDKVFYLNIAEYFYYIECNDFEYARKLRDEAKTKHGYTRDNVDWALASQYSDPYNDNEKLIVLGGGNNVLYNRKADDLLGVIPALHVKPTYVFSDGKKASQRVTGDKVRFGKYNGKAITWDVINVTNDGYALLMADEALDIKPFSVKGEDVIYKKSKYINFSSYDVDISTDLQRQGRNKDKNIPELVVKNDTELFRRQESFFDLQLQGRDVEGIAYITLPDGNKVYSSEATIKILDNGSYEFEVCDVNGNIRQYLFYVGNINKPSTVLVTPSTTEWTNRDIQVNIKASNDVGTYKPKVTTNTRNTWFDMWDNYNTYAGKRVRYSGTVKLVNHTKPLNNVTTSVVLYFVKVNKLTSGDYSPVAQYDTMKSIKLADIASTREYSFTGEYTIPSNYNSELYPLISMDVPGTDVGSYTLEWTNLKIELLDNDGFGIEKIVLPNGTQINASKYTDTITTKGSYTYKIHGNNGTIVQKTIDAKIDKTAPQIGFTYDTSKTNKEFPLSVKVTDSDSGVNRLIDPDNGVYYSDELTWDVENNGSLSFTAYDNAGNIGTSTVNITNFDKEVTDITTSLTPNTDTNKDVVINVNVNDASGVDYIATPNGGKVYNKTVKYTVTTNGLYSFVIFDKVGNFKDIEVVVDNIDKDMPTISMIRNPDKEWVNVDVNVEIDAKD